MKMRGNVRSTFLVSIYSQTFQRKNVICEEADVCQAAFFLNFFSDYLSDIVEEDRIVKEILEEEASAAKESVEEILAEEQQSEEEVEPISTEEPLELENEDPFVQELQEAVSISSEKVCKECGAPMEEDQEFCIMCGTRYGEEKAEKEAEKEEELQERICPNCGSIVKPGHLFCMECGTKQ